MKQPILFEPLKRRRAASPTGMLMLVLLLPAVLFILGPVACSQKDQLGFSQPTPATPEELPTELKDHQQKIDQATDAVVRSGVPPSPGLDALFGGGKEAEERRHGDHRRGQRQDHVAEDTERPGAIHRCRAQLGGRPEQRRQGRQRKHRRDSDPHIILQSFTLAPRRATPT